MSPRHHELLSLLTTLPKKILSHTGSDQIAALVLHDLCSRSGFNLPKAAYFVDNPDFDCLRGIVGLNNAEVCALDNPWKSPHALTQSLESSTFNTKVRALASGSVLKNSATTNQDAIMRRIAQEIGIQNPAYCSWNMKHDNHGILLFERAPGHSSDMDECLEQGASMLGFCPIY